MLRITISLIHLLYFNLTSYSLIAQNSPKSPFGEDGVYVSLSLGVNIDQMIPSGYLIDYLKFDNPTQSYLSALVDFDFEDFNEEEIKGWILRLEVNYKPLNFHASGSQHIDRYDEYEIKARTIMSGFLILYRIPWRFKLQPYAGIGPELLWTNNTKNMLTINYDKTYGIPTEVIKNKFHIDGNLWELVYTAGIQFNKRYDLNCRFMKSKLSDPDDIHNTLKNRSIMISFGYRF
jgi:hypothetical protein